MSNVPIKDANDATRKVDVFTRSEGADIVETQAVAIVDPANGNAARPDAAGNLPVTSPALGAPTDAEAAGDGSIIGLLKRLRTLLGAVLAVDTGLAQPLTNTQLRQSAVDVNLPGAATEATAAATSAALGTAADAAATTDTGSFTLIAFFKRLLGRIPAIATTNDVAPAAPAGRFALTVRRDADSPVASADGNVAPLLSDESGRLKTSVYPASQPVVSGNITASGGQVAIQVDRTGSINVGMVATSLVGHNANFEYSLNSTDGTNGQWYAVQAVRSNANTIETTTGVLAATPAYGWECSVNGYAWFRVRATAHTSGTAAYTLRPSPFATEPIPAAAVTGTQPVSGTVTATGVAGAAAHDAVLSGNPVRTAGRALTANYAAVASGDVADYITTLVGAQITKPYAIPEQEWTASVSLTTTTAVALQAAAAAGIKRHITALWAINTSASAVDLLLQDGASTRHTYPLPPNVPVFVQFPTGIQTTAATALNVNLGAAATAVRVNALGYTAP